MRTKLAAIIFTLLITVGMKSATRRVADEPQSACARQAVEKVLPLLQQSALTWFEKQACNSCHHQGLGLMTVAVARERGFRITPTPTPTPTPAASSQRTNKESGSVRLTPFDFEVVTVNASGQIADRRRERGRSYLEDLGTVTIEMVEIPGGTFYMGSADNEVEQFITEQLKYTKEEVKWQVPFWIRAETPRHKVSISTFYLGKYEVTQAQWRTVANLPRVNLDLVSDPSNFKGSNRPVESISWNEAVEFCERLSRATGHTYRLPTEAEWEYAARGGMNTPFHFGGTVTSELVNFAGTAPFGSTPKGTYREQTVPVGSLGYPNAFGLYDMHGNVWEWCQDWYGANYYAQSPENDPQGPSVGSNRVMRGGGWHNTAAGCRSAHRSRNSPGLRGGGLGFRLVRIK